MGNPFQKALKSKSKLRLAEFGPSGAGKTKTALRVATGITNKIGGRIAYLDSENGSASKYADEFDFDVINLEQKTIEEYIMYMKAAAENGYSVLIIDSMSHAWQELLEEVEQIAKARYRGNTWSAWSEGTPKQRALVDAILSSPCHIIATMRSKTEWQTSTDEKNRSKPVRVGLAPEQGKGIEYEFDMLMEITEDHFATIIKDRTGKFQDKIIEKPDEKFGENLIDWLNSGVDEKIILARKLEAIPEVSAIAKLIKDNKKILDDTTKAYCMAEVEKDHPQGYFVALLRKLENIVAGYTNVNTGDTPEENNANQEVA